MKSGGVGFDGLALGTDFRNHAADDFDLHAIGDFDLDLAVFARLRHLADEATEVTTVSPRRMFLIIS